MASFVLSLIGTDRIGLVEALAEAVATTGGNWDRSHVTELAGTFAGVVLVTVPDARIDDFRGALAPLRDRGLVVTLQRGEDDETLMPHGEAMTFELVGNDHPGIVRDVSHLLATLDVNIVDLRTWTESAAMAGGTLFHATAVVRLPTGLTPTDLVGHLEGLANELMVDLAPAVETVA